MPAPKTPPKRIVSEPLRGTGVTENTISYQGGEQLVRDPGLMMSAAVPEHWNADGSPRPGNPLLDPGPPPVRPPLFLALYGHPVAEMLFNAASPMGGHELAHAADADVIAIRRERLVAVDIFRQPPQMHQYKAELLSWLDALASYHAK